MQCIFREAVWKANVTMLSKETAVRKLIQSKKCEPTKKIKHAQRERERREREMEKQMSRCSYTEKNRAAEAQRKRRVKHAS